MTALEIIGMILLLFLLLSLLRVGVIVDFGGELRVRLRVGPVKLTVLPRKEKKAQKKAAEAAGKTPEEKTKPIFAGDDPADTAQTYGYANAALWTLMPKLEELFYIPKPSVYLGMDFTKAENSAEGTVGVSLRVCDLFAILFTLAVPVGKWFLRWRRAHGGEAKAEPPAERAAVPKTNEPEKRTA